MHIYSLNKIFPLAQAINHLIKKLNTGHEKPSFELLVKVIQKTHIAIVLGCLPELQSPYC